MINVLYWYFYFLLSVSILRKSREKMATADDGGESVKCPICLEHYVEPRKLPNCEHSFCEECLFTYVRKLMDSNEFESGIACPFCRTINPAPKDRDGIRVWCQSLEKNENIQFVSRESNENESTRSDNMCDSCSIFGISSKATKLCNNCFELLCVSCSVGRHSLRSYRNHKLRELEVDSKGNVVGIYLKILRTLREYSLCGSHSEMELEYICEEDGSLCCKKCLVTSHRQCQGAKELTGDALEKEAKSESEMLKQRICKLSAYAKSIIEAKTKNMDENKRATENISKTLQEIRTKINLLLDTLEETTSEQAKSIIKNAEISEEKDNVSLNEMVASLDASSCLIDKVVKHGTVGQIYAALDKTKEAFRQCEHSICAIADAHETDSPDVAIQNSLENIIQLGPNETNKLAKVIKRRNEITLPFYQEPNSLRNSSVRKTAEKSVRENYRASSSPTYSSLIFLPNDQAVLTDTFNGHCSLTNKAYNVIGSRKFSVDVRSCFYTEDGKIAVNSPDDQKIYFLNTDKELKIMAEFTTARKPWTLQALKNGDIAVGWTEPVAFGIISSEAVPTERIYFTEDKAGRNLQSFEYISIDEARKHVIQPCITDNAIYCFDYEGHPKFEYRSNDLSNPQGVALDADGNIFVCSYNESVIHVLSPTGRPIKMIKEGCPHKPLAIAFKACGGEFAVTRGHARGEDDRIVTFFKIQRH